MASDARKDRRRRKRARKRMARWRAKRNALLARRVVRFEEYVERQRFALWDLFDQWLRAPRMYDLKPESIQLQDLAELFAWWGRSAPMMITRDYPIVKSLEPSSTDQALGPAVDRIVATLMKSLWLQRDVDPEQLKKRFVGLARGEEIAA